MENFMTFNYFNTSNYSSPVKVDISNDNEHSLVNGYKKNWQKLKLSKIQ